MKYERRRKDFVTNLKYGQIKGGAKLDVIILSIRIHYYYDSLLASTTTPVLLYLFMRNSMLTIIVCLKK